MNPVMIRIMAVVGIIIGFVFMGLLYGYNEQLYASLSNHCNINSERVITLRLPTNTSTNFALTGGTSAACTFDAFFYESTVRGSKTDAATKAEATTAILAALPGTSFTTPTGNSGTQTVNFETPNGTIVPITFNFGISGGAVSPGATTQWAWNSNATLSAGLLDSEVDTPLGVTSAWETAPGLGGQFRTLTFLLIAVIPLALVAAVIAQAVPLIMSGGSSNVTDIVNKQTMGLLIAAAVIIAAPIMFEQASNAQNDLVGLGSAAQFLTITNLIFDLVPLVYTIGVMGLIIYGSGLAQRFGGGKGMSGMGMRLGM